MLTLLLLVILAALVFEFINGFHDTANSIATVVATKVLTPTQAVMLAATTNLVGALYGTAVAKTIASGLVDTNVVTITSEVLICALTGAIIWNLITWALGLPSSSSHALIGGLCGAALAAGNNNFDVLIWSKTAAVWTENKGLLWKVVIPMVSSPIAGFSLGIIIMGSLMATISGMNYRRWGYGTCGATKMGQYCVRESPTVVSQLYGLCTWQQRCPKNHGYHRLGDICRECCRYARPTSGLG